MMMMMMMNSAPFTMLGLSKNMETATWQNGQTTMEEQPHTFSINPMDLSFSFNMLKLPVQIHYFTDYGHIYKTTNWILTKPTALNYPCSFYQFGCTVFPVLESWVITSNYTLAIFPNYSQNNEHKRHGNIVVLVSEVSVFLGYDASLMGSRFPIFRDHYFDSRCWQLIIQTRGGIYRSSGNLRYATAKTYNLACLYFLFITYGNL